MRIYYAFSYTIIPHGFFYSAKPSLTFYLHKPSSQSIIQGIELIVALASIQKQKPKMTLA